MKKQKKQSEIQFEGTKKNMSFEQKVLIEHYENGIKIGAKGQRDYNSLPLFAKEDTQLKLF